MRHPSQHRIVFCVAALLLIANSAFNQPADARAADLIASTIDQHCAKCHGEDPDDRGGDVSLVGLGAERLADRAELVRGLIDVLDLQEMPPEDEPPLPDPLRQRVISQLREILHKSAAATKPPEKTPIRRMNRFQYNNAVVDLFDLRCTVFTLPERMLREHKGYFRPATGKMPPVVRVGSRPLGKSQLIEPRLAGVAAFPQDLRAEHGFDNRADHLSLSPLLMESFLKLGSSITHSPDFSSKNVGTWTEFFVEPDESVDVKVEVRRRLDTFLTRAFRRPVEDSVLDRYTRYVNSLLDREMAFTSAMKLVSAAVISSPKFLYLYDRDQSAKSNDDFELASRMSFLLWGSLPDQELLDLAATERLSEPAVLEAQYDRMVADHKLKRFCDSFPAQWLQLERIISSVPNREKFPDFYFAKYRASMHMMLEPLLLFETVLIENQPITQLIDPDFTYRSRLLDRLYGDLAVDPLNPKRGGAVGIIDFRRAKLTDRRSGGIITNAAVMTMTSGPERTQPITRGAWMATVVFNRPPEPPPADVPPLGEKPAAGEEHLTLRERLALHRERSDCKGCHEQIDPLGFALENYDAVGRWRQQYENQRDVDMSGTLFRKHDFTNVIEFKDAILSEKDRFASGLAGHLLSFALARPLDARDQVAIERIVSETKADGFRLQSLLKQVVLSAPFRQVGMKSHSPHLESP